MVADWTVCQLEHPSLDSNPWAQKLLELARAVVDHAAGRYPVAPTLMRGPADILSAMRGADRFPMDFYDCADAVSQAAELCADVWIELGKAQLALVPASLNGYVAGAHGLRTWAPDRVIWLQEDAMALLSPRIYRRFILPLDKRIASEFPHTAFHLHGSALWAVEDLAATSEIDLIELNFESAQCDVEGTFAAWKRIQQDKPLVVWKEFCGDEYWPWLHRVLDELSWQGLSIQITVATRQAGQAVVSRTLGAELESHR
jgi:5-methyltetrahydrofolate--homocysteine methyltransferase